MPMKTIRKAAIILAAVSLSGCVTSAPKPSNNQSPTVRSYPQDIEQCLAQPEVVWCVQACSVDPEQEWCGAE